MMPTIAMKWTMPSMAEEFAPIAAAAIILLLLFIAAR
jgi:hypothetical protein